MSKNTCTKILEKEITKVHDVESYGRFSGEVYMAHLLGMLDDGERWTWLAKASDMVPN